MATAPEFHDRLLSLGLARVSEAAAIACADLVGRGDETAADQAASQRAVQKAIEEAERLTRPSSLTVRSQQAAVEQGRPAEGVDAEPDSAGPDFVESEPEPELR